MNHPNRSRHRYTVVLVPVRPSALGSADRAAHVAFVHATSAGDASDAGRRAAADGNAGPADPSGWAAVYVCRGHVPDLRNEPPVITSRRP